MTAAGPATEGDWRLLTPRMVFDERQNRMVLFGGLTGLGAKTASTGVSYTWSGAQWELQPESPAGPTVPAGLDFASAYDSKRGVIRVYGGDEDCQTSDDGGCAWTLDGGGWRAGGL